MVLFTERTTDLTIYNGIMFWWYKLPVVSVVVPGVGRGVDIVCDKPMEVRVTTDTNALHLSLGDIGTVRIEIPQDHHILEHSIIKIVGHHFLEHRVITIEYTKFQ